MVRFGIIGCGGIARKMADALHKSESAELVAVAARDLSRAEAFAAEHGPARAYGSYEELANDPDIDAVYVATIHPAHPAAVMLCLNAGKPVLCEKPMSLTRADDEAMFALARERNLLLMEAVWTRCLPAWRKVRALIEDGAIGRVQAVFTDFTVHSHYDPNSRLFSMEKGGGSLWDIGVYSLHCALYALGTDITAVKAAGRLAPTGADNYAAVTLQFKEGGVAVATCGMDTSGGGCEAKILGDKGCILVHGMMGANACILRQDGKPEEVFHFPYDNGFTFEVEEFCRVLAAGEIESPLVPSADTLAVAGVIDEALAQIRALQD